MYILYLHVHMVMQRYIDVPVYIYIYKNCVYGMWINYIHIYIYTHRTSSTLHDSPSFPLAQVTEASFLSQIGPNPWFLMAFCVNLENST